MTTPKVTCFHDGECPLCNLEINGMKKLDKAGNILVRQLGTVIHPGTNVGCGRDYTLFAMVDGEVKYEAFGKDRKRVSVYPVE